MCAAFPNPRVFVEPKPRKERPKYLSLDEEAVQSRHRLTFDAEGKGWRCSNCQSFGKKAAPTIRLWLQSYCTTVLSDATGPVQVPVGHPHLVGSQVSHSSHSLYFYRGITYCDECGSYCHQTLSTALKKVCSKVCTAQTERQRDKLRGQEVPWGIQKSFPLPQNIILNTPSAPVG